ncbi:MAG TPA: ATP-binding cassette domain-containing protein [Coriobacteriia bacterium]
MTLLLEARDLSAILAGDAGDVRVLDGVSLAVDAGEIVDVVGPSGSGKSTLLRALAKLLPGATGELFVGGSSASALTPSQWRGMVALLPQKPVMFSGTVRDNLVYPWLLTVRRGAQRPGDKRLAADLDRLGVDAALDRDASRLSVGQAARVSFLRTLLTDPTVLLLDEPDAALDDVAADAVAALITEFVAGRAGRGGGAVVRVRHHRPDGIASRRLRLEHGHLTAEEAAR